MSHQFPLLHMGLLLLLLLLLLSEETFAQERLGSYSIDRSKVSVSGLSAGAYFAVQFSVAHSSSVHGAG